MDESVGKCKPFKDLAEGFAERGIAAIRYDKRSKTYGKEMVKGLGGKLTVNEETIEDALLATQLLRDDSRIDSSRIFILGHSMGAMLAPRIDAEGGDYAGLILLAGSPRRLEEIMQDQQQDYLAKSKGIVRWIAGKQIAKLQGKFNNIYTMSDEEAQKTPIIGKYIFTYYLKEWGEKPSAQYLEVLSKPILVAQGDKDFHTSVEKDFNGYKELLAGKSNANFKLYPGLNHLFMPTIYGDVTKAMKEYKVPQHVVPQVIDDLATWMLTGGGS
jgi:dienelactone hydrolase